MNSSGTPHDNDADRPTPTDESAQAALQAEQVAQLDDTWRMPRGWRYWSAVNNTEVGLWYTLTAFAFFFFGGCLALLIRIQLAVPSNHFLTAEQYNQIFTMHGSVMMFLFAVPIFEAISILLLPQMLAARDLPFPRLSAYSYWCFLIGGVFVCGSLFFNAAPRGGWFMYPPLTSAYQDDIGADIWLLGLSFIEISSLAAAVELIVGVLKCRPPGMRINLIPLYAWYILVVAAMILFAFPPLIAGDLLLELERTFDWPFFDPERGGDPLLWQHLFWIFGHPEVYIVFLPSIALVAMIVPTFARTPIIGYSWVVLAAVGTGFLSFGLWVHHMFTTGLPGISIGIFSAASLAVAIPTGVQLFCFLATLLVGRVTRSVSMLFIFGGMATFIIGGLTGVMVAVAPFDFQAHDSYFVVGHLHYVLVGGTIFPIIAGVYYFVPIVTGKQLSERIGRISFVLALIGFNVTFLPMHWTGLMGMPRRVFTYPSGQGFDTLNMVSSIGAFVLAAGLFLFAFDLFRPRRKQAWSIRNPWNAGTLEWLTEIPGKPWSIRSIPEISSRYPLWDQSDLVRDVEAGRFYLPDAPEGKRETLVTSTIDAHIVYCLRVPGPTWLTLLAAVFTAGVFIAATYHWWLITLVSTVLALVLILIWLWSGTADIPEKPTKDVGMGIIAPLYISGPNAVGWWAMFITMLGDMTAFFSLVFGNFFYWTIHEDFPPEPNSGPGTFWPLVSGALLLAAWSANTFSWHCNRRDQAALFYFSSVLAIITCVLSAAALIAGPWRTGLDPTLHVYAATVWVLVGWTAVHLALATIMNAYCLARRAAGRMTGQYDAEITNVSLYWHFMALTGLVTIGVIAGFPLVT